MIIAPTAISAVGDERTRPSHLALNGRIYRYDDPFGQHSTH
ncbi:phage minor head protein [Pasteurella multocida]|nr:phage minor head protein [Pasteurella multocida]